MDGKNDLQELAPILQTVLKAKIQNLDVSPAKDVTRLFERPVCELMSCNGSERHIEPGEEAYVFERTNSSTGWVDVAYIHKSCGDKLLEDERVRSKAIREMKISSR